MTFCSVAVGMAQEPYYKGKTVRIVVGFSAGGGFDTYSRCWHAT
jgi:tripartite-type tricarboxylate transporter receptor subunit TctC